MNANATTHKGCRSAPARAARRWALGAAALLPSVFPLAAHAAPSRQELQPAAVRAPAADAGQTRVRWSARTVTGEAIEVPDRRAVSLVVFVRTDQQRSHDALAVARAAVKNLPATEAPQSLVVVSGEGSAARAKELRGSGECPWPAVADADYTAADRMGVRVWPTTLLITPSGEVAAHLAGLPKNYARDLEKYLAFAAGRIDAATLKDQLAGSGAVIDDAQQMAHRHLQVAALLLKKGMNDKARQELAAALKLRPESPALRLELARALVTLGDARAALDLIDANTEAAVAPAQVHLVRGAAFLRLGRWEAARDELQQATRLNPQPAEAWYRLGLAYQQLDQPVKAADAFRKGFEYTDLGQECILATPASESDPEPRREPQ